MRQRQPSTDNKTKERTNPKKPKQNANLSGLKTRPDVVAFATKWLKRSTWADTFGITAGSPGIRNYGVEKMSLPYRICRRGWLLGAQIHGALNELRPVWQLPAEALAWRLSLSGVLERLLRRRPPAAAERSLCKLGLSQQIRAHAH